MALDPVTAGLEALNTGAKIVAGGQANRQERIKQQTEAIKALAGISSSRSVAQAEAEKAKGRTKMIIAISVGVLILGVATAFVVTSMKKK